MREVAVVADPLDRLRKLEREAWELYVHAVNHENDDIRSLAEVAWMTRFRDLQVALND